MSIIVDVIIVIIMLLSIFLGYRQGLIKAAIKIAAFFIAIVVALILYKPVSNIIINNTPVEDRIQSAITNKILPEGADPNSEVQENNDIPSFIINAAGNTVNSIAHALTVEIIQIVVLLLIFILVRFALKFITILADLIAKIPILKQFNELRRSNIWTVKRIYICICNTCSNIIYSTYDRWKYNTDN